MKISVDLINRYLKKPLKTQQMAEVLETTEVEVEEILYAKQLDEKIIVARVVELSKHPNADKLKLAKVETYVGLIDVVCGAPNIEKGMTVALAQVGTTLPSGDVIEEAKIRGEKSHGMLCSAMELGWGDDHSGLVALDPSLPLGKSLCDIATTTDVLDIKTPSNRWDYMSYLGLSREIAACLSDNSLVEPESRENEYLDREVVKVKERQLCPAFYSVKVKIKNDVNSPKWLVDNLNASGMRSVNPVVDITNFVMLEYGQPSHAYDAKKLKGPLGVRFATTAESLKTLDDKDIKLDAKDLVVVDNSGPVALAGVMGGKSTEADTSTTEIVLEVANFDKTVTRRSALRHGIRTEASARFEKGLPLPLPHVAMNRLISLLIDICEAEVVDSPVSQLYSADASRFIGMRVRRAEKFLGYKLDEKELMGLLNKRGFKPEHFSFTKEVRKMTSQKFDRDPEMATAIYQKAGIDISAIGSGTQKGMGVPANGLKLGDVIMSAKGKPMGLFTGNSKVTVWDDTKKQIVPKPALKFISDNKLNARRYVENFNHIISVVVPWWRDDVQAEVDLFEEVAKSIGYGEMPETLPALPPSDTKAHQLLPSFMNLRTVLSGAGADEIMTYSFVSKKDLEHSLSDQSKCLQIENPLSSEQDYLRTNMMASHLRVAEKNYQIKQSAGVYEIARVYERTGKSAAESWKLSIMVWGDDSLLRLKGLIDVLLGSYGTDFDIRRDLNCKLFVPSRSAVIGGGIGRFGQVNPVILSNFDIQNDVAWAEIDLLELQLSIQPKKIVEPIPYQLIKKDLSVELESLVTYYELREKLLGLVAKVDFKSEFSNDDLKSKSLKRLTVSLTMDLGPNPKGEEIKELLDKCSLKASELPKAKVL